jgi:hypothetical protein
MDMPMDSTTEGRGLIEVLHDLEAREFRGQFGARPGGQVECSSCSTRFDAADLEIDCHERLEGASDPADMMLVAGVSCPRCHAKGALVLTYGPMASEEDAAVEGRLPLGG